MPNLSLDATLDPGRHTRARSLRRATDPGARQVSISESRRASVAEEVHIRRASSVSPGRRSSTSPGRGWPPHQQYSHLVNAMQQLTQAMTEMRADAKKQEQQAEKEREERVAAQAELATLKHSFVALEARFAEVDAANRRQTEDLQGVVDLLHAQATETHRLAETASSDANFAQQTVRTVNLKTDDQGLRLERADEQISALREATRGCASAADQQATATAVAGVQAKLGALEALSEKLNRELPAQLQAQGELLEKLRKVAARHDVQLRALTQELLAQKQAVGTNSAHLEQRFDALHLSFKRWQALEWARVSVRVRVRVRVRVLD